MSNRGKGRFMYRHGPYLDPFKTDLHGKVFGWLVVIGYAGKSEDGYSMWDCYCGACGKQKAIRGHSLVAGKVRGCGCLSITHGLTRGGKPPEYKSWCQIKDRCFNTKSRAYPDYGGRGISMCKRWDNSFSDFLADVGPRPKGTSIERIDNNKGYEPGNCRWATDKEQANNRRSTRWVEFNGKIQTLMQWSEELGCNYKLLHDRLYRYRMPIAVAFSKSI